MATESTEEHGKITLMQGVFYAPELVNIVHPGTFSLDSGLRRNDEGRD